MNNPLVILTGWNSKFSITERGNLAIDFVSMSTTVPEGRMIIPSGMLDALAMVLRDRVKQPAAAAPAERTVIHYRLQSDSKRARPRILEFDTFEQALVATTGDSILTRHLLKRIGDGARPLPGQYSIW